MLAKLANGNLRSIDDYSKAYNAILQKWSVNHNEEDFLRYKYKHKWEFADIHEIPDKDLSGRMFQEYYDISAGGVALLTLIGGALMAFLGYIIWDSIDVLNQPDGNVQIEGALQNMMDSANRLEAETNRLVGAGQEAR